MHTKIYGLEMFRVVLFIIVKILERNEISNCEGTVNKLQNIHLMDYYAAILNNIYKEFIL